MQINSIGFANQMDKTEHEKNAQIHYAYINGVAVF